MSDDFYGRLEKTFPDLLKLIQERKYIILEPKKKLISPSSLTKNFYYNHIFYISNYDPNLFINLNGKVLKHEKGKFTSYLGWKKDMILSIKEENDSLNYGNKVYILDNVCDDINYTETKSTNTDNNLKPQKTMQNYIDYSEKELTNLEGFKRGSQRLTKFIKEMKVNYMFMKGHENFYSDIFNKRMAKLINYFTDILKGNKEDYNYINNIVKELLDSLAFNELYDHIFNNGLVQFYKDEEGKMKNMLKGNPPKYEWEGLKVDAIYYQCKFLAAIQYLDNLSKYKTIFEKIEVISNVNDLIIEEAKNIFESNNKTNFKSEGLILNFWIYVVAHCKTKNIIAEAKFIYLFGLGGSNAKAYVATTFVTAVDAVKTELLQSEKLVLSQYVEPNKINLPNIK